MWLLRLALMFLGAAMMRHALKRPAALGGDEQGPLLAAARMQ